MRITPSEIARLTQAITPFVTGEEAELRLYGSRVHDTLKGGDLDLLLLVDNDEKVNSLMMQKHYILAAIKKQLGDRQLDLLIASHGAVASHTFLSMIFPESVILHRFLRK